MLKLHIILAFIIFSRSTVALTQGLFVSVLPALSLHHHHQRLLSSSLLNTFGSGLPLWLKNSCVSMLPLSSSAACPPFGAAFCQSRLLAGGDVCRPHENECLYFLKRPLSAAARSLVLTAHFAAQISGVNSPRNAHSMPELFQADFFFVLFCRPVGS